MIPAPFSSRLPPDDGDPLDLQLHRVGAAPAVVDATPWHVRFGLGWSARTPPVVLLLIVGALLGPGALSILTPAALSAIDPALPVALATLGVHIALGLPMDRETGDHRLFQHAAIQAALTSVVVTAGMLMLQKGDSPVLTFHMWVIALAAGACAATSAQLPSGSDATAEGPTLRLRQLDPVLPIAAGGLILAWVREDSLAAASLLVVQSGLLALVIALAGWLLLTRSASDTESRILGAATLLLLGGLADYLSLSALWSGLVAGVFWRLAPGQVAERLRRDVRHVLHPLLVLMLLAAGARIQVTVTLLTLALGYVLLRSLGKLVGGRVIGTRDGLPDDLGLTLLFPGIVGIAFAVNTVRAAGTQAEPLLGIVVFGTIGSQLLAATRRGEPRG